MMLLMRLPAMSAFMFDPVIEDLKNKGITVYSIYQANGCVGVSYGNVSCYYYVRDGRIVDIIFD